MATEISAVDTQQDHSVSQRDIAMQTREATLVPATYSEADNTVEVVWTTGSRRRAYDYWNDTYYDEELVVTTDAVDMTRFDAGVVQCLDGHRVYGGVGAILGVAVRGWISGNEGRALIRLSVNPDNAGIVADIKAGVIRSISFGYSVQRYEVTDAKARTDGGSVPLYRATLWTPQEISFVTVPADPNAQTRSASSAGGADAASQTEAQARALTAGPCEFVTRAAAHSIPGDTTMPQTADTTQGGDTATPDKTAIDAATRAASDAAVERAAGITELCARHNVPQLAVDLIRSGKPVEAAGLEILGHLARNDAATGGHRNVRIETVQDEVETRMAGQEEAILHRMDGRIKLTDNGRRFRGLSLLDMGRRMLEQGGRNTEGLTRSQLMDMVTSYRSGAGMHGVSDFAYLLSNVSNKRLQQAYQENEASYRVWARRAPNAPDFKTQTIVRLSSMPDLLKQNEHGEVTYGSISDGAEQYALTTYSRGIAFTRQAIINDDLRGFDRAIAAFSAAAARLENRTVYAQLTSNPTMGDGTALFHANHGNLMTSAGVLAFAALTEARRLMRVQKGMQNEELNIAPAYLIVPAALEQAALQFTSSQYVPAKPSDVNEFRNGGRTAVEPVVEAILDGVSNVQWYMAAANSQVDTVEYCYLDGAEGPQVMSGSDFDVDGLKVKCVLDFAAKAGDWRGLLKSNGVA